MPYFDGDFWPTAIEDLIAEVLKEQAQEEAEKEADIILWDGREQLKQKNSKFSNFWTVDSRNKRGQRVKFWNRKCFIDQNNNLTRFSRKI